VDGHLDADKDADTEADSNDGEEGPPFIEAEVLKGDGFKEVNKDHKKIQMSKFARSDEPKVNKFQMKIIQSLRVVFPAACGEFVIPAEAGIQKTGLDSASSAE
jgi:hypothetical protein